MTTSYTSRTKPTTSYTSRPKFIKWLDYFRYNDGATDNIVCTPDWDKITFISKSGSEQIDYWTQYTTRPVI